MIDSKRLELMSNGVEELERWLLDMLREGIALLEQAPPDYWDELSARMVNAKLGAVARRIRTWPRLLHQPQGPEALIAEIADLLLFIQAFQRLSKWAPDRQADLLMAGGLNLKKEKVLQEKPLKDHWLVVGQQRGEEENLRFRRTWLLGEKSRSAVLLLDFAWGANDFTEHWITGSALVGEVVFYPSHFPQRGLVKNFNWSQLPFDAPAGFTDHTALLNAFAQALEANPWLFTFPCLLAECRPVLKDATWWLLDHKDQMLTLGGPILLCWQLMALSGGKPVTLFGEWNGDCFFPLTVLGKQRLIELSG